ncbi:unnamed protein product, partial [Coregonus sp. 'balchen']
MILCSLANKSSDPREDQQSTMQQPEASVRQKEEEERYVQQHAKHYFAELPFEVETEELSVDPATHHNPESSKQRSMSRDS